MSRAFAIIIVALVAITWAGYLVVQGADLAWEHLGPFSLAVGVLTTTAFLFEHWLWHWPIVHVLTKTPRLAGTWIGTLSSSYSHEGEPAPIAPIDVVVVVTQTAGSLSVRQFTGESASTTTAASISEDAGDRFALATVYLSEPALELQRGRSRMHHGATRLMVEGPPRSPTKLVGSYWTTRHTSGELDLKFVSRERAHSFAAGLSLPNKPNGLVARTVRRFRSLGRAEPAPSAES